MKPQKPVENTSVAAPLEPAPEATPAPNTLTLTAEELDELEPIECCPSCLTHPNNR